MANLSSIGRFSSQMLTYLGAQRNVVTVNGSPTNAFKYANGPVVFPNPSNVSQAALGSGVVGNFSPTAYDTTRCYFINRGASAVYADTMTALAIDMATLMNVTPQAFLEQAEKLGKIDFTDDTYRAFNILRDPSSQVGKITSVDNRNSLQSRQIRV